MNKLQGFGRNRAEPRNWRLFVAFGRDENGTVAIQTLIFSVLLFGSAGLVLDTGRVYVAHSQMQAFADQMAIAAANELDGRDDALERATAAVFGINGQSFLAKAGIEVGAFEVASLDFYTGTQPSTRPQNDTSEAFPPENRVARATDGAIEVTGGDPVEAANDATVAVVSVTEKEVRSAVAHMTAAVTKIAVATGIGSRDGELFADGLRIAAIAAASMERRSCAALSSLVLCNPWEGAPASPLDVPKDDPAWSLPGRSLAYFAPNFAARGLSEAPQVTPNGASIFPWDLRNQLFRLVSPVADSAGLCSPDYLLALAAEDATSEAAPDYMAARDRCLMARAHAEMVCWGPGVPLTIAPADGGTVTRALNIIFDNWPQPFRQALSANLVIGSTGLFRIQYFEPDALATTTYESADRHGPDPDTEPQQDGEPDYEKIFEEEGLPGAYETVPMPGSTPLRAVHRPAVGYDPCHDGTYGRYAGTGGGEACAQDFVGDYHEGGGAGAGAVRAALEHYWSKMYQLEPDTLPGSVTTWYELYRREKEMLAALDTSHTAAPNSRINQFSDENVSRYGLGSPDEEYVKQGPDEYLNVSGNHALLNSGYERRRLRSAMVNCQATVANGFDGGAGYEVDLDDARIVDVYLPAPPGIFCGPGEIGCDLDDAVETRLFVELVDDLTEHPNHRRYVARLVR